MFSSKSFFHYIKKSPTSLHAAAVSADIVAEKEAVALRPEEPWSLEAGKIYHLQKRGLFAAFRPGKLPPWETGIALCAAHTDSPSLKLKFESGTRTSPFLRVPVELYGGAIVSSWLDRELSCSGLVVSADSNRLFTTDEPVAIIPNLAIHLNPKVNDGYGYQLQDELQALFPGIPSLRELVSNHSGLPGDDILAADLFLHDHVAPSELGGVMVSGRIDNLASCYAALSAFLDASALGAGWTMILFSDAEEVGSTIDSGADSALPINLLRRIVAVSGGGEEEFQRTLARSFLVSADGAHAVHPNFSSKHDPDFAPRIGGGPVVKMNALYRYATNAESAGVFISLCNEAGVSYQRLIGRSDMKSGSTVGSILSAALSINTVDVGIPMLAMHSIRECASFEDLEALYRVLLLFFRKAEGQ